MNSAYQWPDYYDWTSPTENEDVLYYVELAKETGGPVLELGCGTGRCSLAIAREGIEVVGLDLSREMLNRAKQKADEFGLSQRVTWIEADMSNFSIPDKTFPLVIIPYRSFLHLLTVKDQLNALKCIRSHLQDGGMLALNVFVPHVDQLVDIDRKYQYRGCFPIPGTEEKVEIYDFTEVDPFYQLCHITRYYERFDGQGKMLERIKTHLHLRYIFPTELSLLLALCGFKIVNRYGSFAKDEFDRHSDELIIEAIKVSPQLAGRRVQGD